MSEDMLPPNPTSRDKSRYLDGITELAFNYSFSCMGIVASQMLVLLNHMARSCKALALCDVQSN